MPSLPAQKALIKGILRDHGGYRIMPQNLGPIWGINAALGRYRFP